MSWNARGMCNKTTGQELQKTLDNMIEKPDVICIQETKQGLDKQPFKLKGYQKPLVKHIRNNSAGGLAIYVRSGINFVENKINHQGNAEILSCQILGRDNDIFIYNYYIHIGSLNQKKDWEESFDKKHKNVIITGDFNLKHILWNPEGDFRSDTEALKLIEFMEDRKLSCINDGQVTRIANQHDQQGSAIDLAIISDNLLDKAEFLVIDNTIGSDHLPIMTIINQNFNEDLIHLKETWKIKNATSEQWNEFKSLCNNKLTFNPRLDVNKNFKNLTSTLYNILDEAIPKTKGKIVKRKPMHPWWNDACENAVKLRETLRKRHSKLKTTESKTLWKNARNNVHAIIKQARNDSWETFCSNITNRTTSKDLWTFFSKIKGKDSTKTPVFKIDDQYISDPRKKADLLVNHYQKVSSNAGYDQDFLVNKVLSDTRTDLQLNLMRAHTELGFNKNFTMFELELALKKCKSGAPGPDDIHYDILKALPQDSKIELLKLFNQSWATGKTPDSWSEAIIIPILKPAKNSEDPASYRPISLTSTFTKLMQKMIKPRLCSFLEENNLLSDYQSGCRENHSCDDNLVRLESDIKRAQCANQYLLAIFLDLSSAFDKLWNGGALKYLYNIGIKGRLLKWIQDFLKTRKITVKLNGQLSETVETINGCPQGSVLSPIIFSLIMNTYHEEILKHNNDMEKQKKPHFCASISQFVDDSATWVTSKSPKLAVEKAQAVLNVIEQWSKKYGFFINPKKTQVVIYQRPHTVHHEKNTGFPKLKLCNQDLEYVEVAKFLGMFFDKCLTWKSHIQYIKQRCFKDMNLLKCVKGSKWGVNKTNLCRIYKGLILSKINYGSIVYASASNTQLKELQILQNQALRIVLGIPRHTKRVAMLVESAELPLELIREASMLKYWARSSTLGDTLPINLKLTDDPAFEHSKLKTSKKPYSQKILDLINEYELNEINIQPRHIIHTEELEIFYTDTYLSEIISKKDLDPNSLQIVQEYIGKTYPHNRQIFTDGSKQDTANFSGWGGSSI